MQIVETKLLWITVVLYFAVVSVKIFGGIVSENIALFADGLDSIKNIITSIIAIKFFKISRESPDTDHPYGHSKFDFIGTIVIGTAMIFISGIIATTVILKVPKQPHRDALFWSFLSFVLMIFVSAIFWFLSRKFKSEVLHTEALHYLADVGQTAGVVLVVLLSEKFTPIFGNLFAFAIAIYLFVVGVLKIKRASYFLLDYSVEPKIKEDILKIVEEEGYKVGDIKAIVTGKDKIRLDIMFICSPELSAQELDRMFHEIERKLKSKLDVEVENFTVHFEPKKDS